MTNYDKLVVDWTIGTLWPDRVLVEASKTTAPQPFVLAGRGGPRRRRLSPPSAGTRRPKDASLKEIPSRPIHPDLSSARRTACAMRRSRLSASSSAAEGRPPEVKNSARPAARDREEARRAAHPRHGRRRHSTPSRTNRAASRHASPEQGPEAHGKARAQRVEARHRERAFAATGGSSTPRAVKEFRAYAERMITVAERGAAARAAGTSRPPERVPRLPGASRRAS
jgi:hypothetical protein